MSGMPKGTVCHRWTEAERKRLAELAAQHMSSRRIGEAMTAEFGDFYGGKRINAAMKRYGIRNGRDTRFRKGQEPANKGRTWEEYMSAEGQERSRATCFRKGDVHDRPDGWLKPVGYERTDKDGYTWVKVRDSRTDGLQAQVPGRFNENYRLKHRVVWEQCNGPIPKGTVIAFADRDRTNFDPANLVAVERSDWQTIQKRGMAYYDAESLRACIAAARLVRAAAKAERAPRPCGTCGEVFNPRFAKQRTCDACLEDRRKHA